MKQAKKRLRALGVLAAAVCSWQCKASLPDESAVKAAPQAKAQEAEHPRSAAEANETPADAKLTDETAPSNSTVRAANAALADESATTNQTTGGTAAPIATQEAAQEAAPNTRRIVRDFDEDWRPGPPDEIAGEEEHLAAAYDEFYEEKNEGIAAWAFISNTLDSDFSISRNELDSITVASASLDDEGEFTLVWLNYGGLEHAFVVLDSAGKVRDKLAIAGRARAQLRDVVRDSAPELFVNRILGTGLSTYPSEWNLYRVDSRGKFRELLSFPKSHATGSKTLSYAYMNHFDFVQANELEIVTIYSTCAEDEFIADCPDLGATSWFSYNEKADRYLRRTGTRPTGK